MPPGKPGRKRGVVIAALLLTVTFLVGVMPVVAQAPAAARFNATTRAQIDALRQEQAVRTPAQNKIASALYYAAREQASGRAAVAAAPELRSGVELETDGRVRVKIKATVTPELLGAIQATGGTTAGSYPTSGVIYATLPLGSLETLAARSDVGFIYLPPTVDYNRSAKASSAVLGQIVAPLANTAVNDPEGDATHGAATARAQYGATGRGIKVGIISDSLDNASGDYQAALLNDYVPTVTVVPGQAGNSMYGSAEGLAMLETVHRLAPEAQLFFATSGDTEEQMALNINALVADGCNIIIDDLAFSDESPFQDDVIAQSVNAASAKGVLYFSCAANYGNKDAGMSSCWEGDFKAVPGAPTILDFQPGSAGGPQELNRVSADFNGRVKVVLFWSEPLGNATSSYALYETDARGSVLQAAYASGQDPVLTLENVGTGNYVAVEKLSGADRFLHLDIYAHGTSFQYSTAGRVRGHDACAAPNAFCVAATPAAAGRDAASPSGPYPNLFNSGNQVEPFSCDGPRRIFFNPDGSAITPGNFSSTGGRLLAKPDFTAADGVSTSLSSGYRLNPFFGTSCAAPHAGAIAAMLLSYRPGLTPAQAGAALRVGTVQIINPGEGNRDSGVGILLAPNVLQSVSPPPSVVTFSPANGPVGTLVTVTGFNLGTVTGASFNAVPATFSVVSDRVVTATVPAGAGTGPIALLTAGGTAISTTNFTTTVLPPAPIITSVATASGMIGRVFSYQTTATNGPTFFSASGLPSGLNIDLTTGLISGVPATPGTFPVTLSAGNATGGSGSAVLTIIVLPALPVITSASTANGQVGSAFTFQIGGSNSPTGYAATGLPVGLGLDPSSGLITGVPTTAGTYLVTVSATNAGGTGSAILTIQIVPAIPTVTLAVSISTASVSAGTIGQFVVSLSEAQDHDVVVAYAVKGTAANGTDYALLKGTAKLKAGKTSKAIKVMPRGDLGGAAKKTVVLILQPGAGYSVGTTGKVKVKISREP